MKLKEIRKKNNLTQVQVAKYLNTTHQTYNNYENEKYEPSIDMLIKLAELFHTSIDNLIRENTDKVITEQYPHFQQELINEIEKLNQIECAKVSAYIEGLKAGKKEYEQEKLFNKYKGKI